MWECVYDSRICTGIGNTETAFVRAVIETKYRNIAKVIGKLTEIETFICGF